MARSVLCVEGRGDEVVLQSLIEHYQPVLPDVTIERRDGKDGVLKTLRAQLPIRDDKQYTAIGIIIDADDDLANTWTRCCDTLRRNGYDALPGTPDPIGTILSASERPTVGFWLMPDNQNIGALEQFIGALVPNEDILWGHAATTLDALPEKRFAPKDRQKAHVHIWLAW